jgi:broad specificity phosphatase PhoE
MYRPRWTRVLLLGIALIGTAYANADGGGDGQERLWQALTDGRHVALMRHAQAPGIGDPAEFDLDDCATQRNLSEQGRAQAKAIGDRFRANGISSAQVQSSQWCRCLETARLLDLGKVKPNPALNSFFRNNAKESERTAAARALIQAQAGKASNEPLVLVTHQVNITALTGVFPASGEILVVKPTAAGIETIGRIRSL